MHVLIRGGLLLVSLIFPRYYTPVLYLVLIPFFLRLMIPSGGLVYLLNYTIWGSVGVS